MPLRFPKPEPKRGSTHSTIELPKFTFILGTEFVPQFEFAKLIAEEYTAIQWLHQPVYEAACHLAMGGIYNLGNIDLPTDLDKPFPPLPKCTMRDVCNHVYYALERLSDGGAGVDPGVLARMAIYARQRDGMDVTFKNDIYSDVTCRYELAVFNEQFPLENKLILVPSKHTFWGHELALLKAANKLSQAAIVYISGATPTEWFESFKFAMQPSRSESK